ncbi:Asp-tRNA(Asn)/Glu-tRNA(Gln) amidotransferase subunit GatA [Candidatus Woesearchaeota archaeon]|nr:Asp-tRNA(Asn)/Glu-tRNA(Gln) amidotransferase subunit GatA [Candidatus Woesearchaeota archaeon]
MRTLEVVELIRKGNLSIEESTHKVIEEVKKLTSEYNYFNTIAADTAIKRAKELDAQIKKGKKSGKLLGIPISVKDSICVKGMESTGGSRILEGYIPPFNATAVQRCLDEGAIVIGKTSQDEFGFGGFSVNVGVGYKVPKNPFDKTRTCGGSSGGCAGYTQKTAYNQLSIGESTGGSIVEPASFCGIVGLCPTYGRVSRYGLMDFSNAMDKIGPMTRTLEDAALLLEVIAGFDSNESTTINAPVDSYTKVLKKSLKGMKFAVIKEAFAEGLDPAVEKHVWNGIKKLESAGATYEEISLKIPIKYGISTYYLLGTSEASTNLAKYCGMRYGKQDKLEGSFNEYFTKVRSSYLGEEAKRRIMLGTFARMAGYRDAYYLKALKVRTLMINEYKKAFKKYDVLATPTVSILPPKFSEIEKLTPLQCYMIDVLTVGPNIAGLPHLNMPVGMEKGLPVGMLLTADHLQEGKLVQLGSWLE